MTDPAFCQKCGKTVSLDENFCPHCGAQLHSVPGTGRNLNPSAYEGPDFKSYEDAKRVDRTKQGLEVMIAGLILSWIPIILYIGGLLEFIGAILIILGRDAFGEKHSGYVVMAILLFIIYFFGTIAILMSLGSSIPSVIYSASAFISTFREYLIATMVMSAIAGISQMLLVFGISNKKGTEVLTLAYISQLAVIGFIFVVIFPMITSAATLAITTHNTGPITDIENRLNIYHLLDAIPALIFAAGYYLARTRIVNKEIPFRPSTSN